MEDDIEKNKVESLIENEYKKIFFLKNFDVILKYIPPELFNKMDKIEEKNDKDNNENCYLNEVEFLKFTNKNIKLLNKIIEE